MTAPEPADGFGPCTCVTLRRASRAITGYYDSALEGTGLLVTQLSLLRAIERAGEPTITALADKVALDRTTLARNLRLLETEGLIRIVPKDKRSRSVQLTARGTRKIGDALVPWRKAETRIRALLGPDTLQVLNATRKMLEGLS
jgi:DNA-binding MarR family transcriptional regulator